MHWGKKDVELRNRQLELKTRRLSDAEVVVHRLDLDEVPGATKTLNNTIALAVFTLIKVGPPSKARDLASAKPWHRSSSSRIFDA